MVSGMTFESVFMLYSDEWDKLVSTTYSRPYCFQQQDGCKNRGTYWFSVPCKNPYDFSRDSIKEEVNTKIMGVSFKAWLSRDPLKLINNTGWSNTLWWHRNFYPNLEMVVDDLYKKGLLMEGEYAINIDW